MLGAKPVAKEVVIAATGSDRVIPRPACGAEVGEAVSDEQLLIAATRSEEVIPGPACHPGAQVVITDELGVVPRSRIPEDVVTDAASVGCARGIVADQLLPSAPGVIHEHVVTGADETAARGTGGAVADEAVASAPAVEVIVAARVDVCVRRDRGDISGEPVVAGSPSERVVSPAAADGVVSAPSADHVIASSSADEVAVGSSPDHVSTGRAPDRGVPGAPRFLTWRTRRFTREPDRRANRQQRQKTSSED
jgi:hypothetical protein